ncbi:MAG: PadR family transcriptional regulator [Bacillus sp. (in: firmicutes)]
MYIDILILGQLLSGPKYGYEIKKAIQEDFGDEIEINNNMLYPTLKRFLEMGAILRSNVVKPKGKPDRQVYELTGLGQEMFHQMISDFPSRLAGRQIEFLGRVALFNELLPAVRLEIFGKRENILRKKLQYYKQVESKHLEKPYVMEVLSFLVMQVESELQWIDKLKQMSITEPK